MDYNKLIKLKEKQEEDIRRLETEYTNIKKGRLSRRKEKKLGAIVNRISFLKRNNKSLDDIIRKCRNVEISANNFVTTNNGYRIGSRKGRDVSEAKKRLKADNADLSKTIAIYDKKQLKDINWFSAHINQIDRKFRNFVYKEKSNSRILGLVLNPVRNFLWNRHVDYVNLRYNHTWRYLGSGLLVGGVVALVGVLGASTLPLTAGATIGTYAAAKSAWTFFAKKVLKREPVLKREVKILDGSWSDVLDTYNFEKEIEKKSKGYVKNVKKEKKAFIKRDPETIRKNEKEEQQRLQKEKISNIIKELEKIDSRSYNQSQIDKCIKLLKNLSSDEISLIPRDLIDNLDVSKKAHYTKTFNDMMRIVKNGGKDFADLLNEEREFSEFNDYEKSICVPYLVAFKKALDSYNGLREMGNIDSLKNENAIVFNKLLGKLGTHALYYLSKYVPNAIQIVKSNDGTNLRLYNDGELICVQNYRSMTNDELDAFVENLSDYYGTNSINVVDEQRRVSRM